MEAHVEIDRWYEKDGHAYKETTIWVQWHPGLPKSAAIELEGLPGLWTFQSVASPIDPTIDQFITQATTRQIDVSANGEAVLEVVDPGGEITDEERYYDVYAGNIPESVNLLGSEAEYLELRTENEKAFAALLDLE